MGWAVFEPERGGPRRSSHTDLSDFAARSGRSAAENRPAIAQLTGFSGRQAICNTSQQRIGIGSTDLGKHGTAMKKKTHKPSKKTPIGPWMSTLAQMAAECRSDGISALKELTHAAKFDLRPRMSLQKHLANDESPQFLSKQHAA